MQGQRVDLEKVIAERDELQKKLDKVRAEKDAIQAQLRQTQAEHETLKVELYNIYHSRSFRNTTPMRVVIGFGRIQRERLYQLCGKLAIRTRVRRLLRKTVEFSRGIPLTVLLTEKIKHRFPRAWRRMSAKVKGMITEPQESTIIAMGNPEDEIHFLHLFQHEINKRSN